MKASKLKGYNQESFPVEGGYSPADYANLPVSAEMK